MRPESKKPFTQHNQKLKPHDTQTICIHSGTLKGLRLQLPPKTFTRPTKSILRESFFNTIAHQVVGCVFIEGFGGSGSMGIEALSRGAKEIVFYEINPQIAQILELNLNKALARLDSIHNENLTQKTQSAHIIQQSFFYSFEMLQNTQSRTLLYLDPPFFTRKGMQELEQQCFEFIATLRNPHIFLIAFEHISIINLPKNLGKYVKIRAKKFGKSTISYYTLM